MPHSERKCTFSLFFCSFLAPKGLDDAHTHIPLGVVFTQSTGSNINHFQKHTIDTQESAFLASSQTLLMLLV